MIARSAAYDMDVHKGFVGKREITVRSMIPVFESNEEQEKRKRALKADCIKSLRSTSMLESWSRHGIINPLTDLSFVCFSEMRTPISAGKSKKALTSSIERSEKRTITTLLLSGKIGESNRQIFRRIKGSHLNACALRWLPNYIRDNWSPSITIESFRRAKACSRYSLMAFPTRLTPHC